MKKIAFALAATGLMSLAACHKAPPSTENTATAMESDLMNNAAAMENEANAATNNAAAAAVNSASAAYTNSVDSIRAEADAAKNTH